jgi:hypothetical protein
MFFFEFPSFCHCAILNSPYKRMKQALVYTIFAGLFVVPFFPFLITPSLLFSSK